MKINVCLERRKMVVEGTEDKEVEAALLGGATPAKKMKAARFQVAQVDKEDKGGDEDGGQVN